MGILADALQRARSGLLLVIALSGEPGIRKSRLLVHFLPRGLTDDGVVVLRGGATRAEGLPPYLPFVEALGDYCAAASVETLRERVGAAGPILATLLPQLEERLGPFPTPSRLAPEEERWRMFEE